MFSRKRSQKQPLGFQKGSKPETFADSPGWIHSSGKTSRRVSVPRILLFLFALAGLGVGGYFLNNFQVKKQTSSLIERATQAEKAEEWERASDYLKRFLAVDPKNGEALSRYALFIAKNPKTPREIVKAIGVLSKASIQNPDREDIKRRLVELSTMPGYGEVVNPLTYIDALLQKHPNEMDLLVKKGGFLASSNRLAEADTVFAKAVQMDRTNIDAGLGRAGFLRFKMERPRDGDAAINVLLANNKSAKAYLSAGAYWQAAKNLEAAKEAFQNAYKLDPTDPEVAVAYSNSFLMTRDFDTASKALRGALEKHPGTVSVIRTLAKVEIQQGNRTEASNLLKAGLEKHPDDPDLIWESLDLQIENGDSSQVADGVKKLQKMGFPAGPIRFLQARVPYMKSEWLEASRILDEAIPLLTLYQDLDFRASMMLGECCGRLGDADRELVAFQRAKSIFPLNSAATMATAAAMAKKGQTAEASKLFEGLAKTSPIAAINLVRSRLVDTFSKPEAKRNWAPVQEAIESAEKLNPGNVDLMLLKGDYFLGRKDYAMAKDALEKARQASPDNIAPLRALAYLAVREGKPVSEGMAILDEAAAKLGDSAELRLAKARLLTANGLPKDRSEFDRLWQGIDSLPAPKQAELLQGISGILLANNDMAGADAIMQEMAKRKPDDLVVQMIRFDLARMQKKDALQIDLIKKIREIEGKEGPNCALAQALYLIDLAKQKGDRSGLELAKEKLDLVNRLKPNWSRQMAAEAQLQDLRGKVTQAITAYQRALDAGENNPAFVRRLVELLYFQRRFADANEVLKKVPELLLDSSTKQLAVEVMMQGNDKAKALAAVDSATSDDSRNASDWIWRGRMLLAGGQKEPAEAAFKKAVELGGDTPMPWLALVEYLVTNKRLPEAEQAVASAQKALDPKTSALVIGRCYELCGQGAKAKTHYETSLKNNPQDIPLLRNIADFSARTGDIKAAEDYFNRIIKSSRDPEDVAWARRGLATALAKTSRYPMTPKAMTILGLETNDNKLQGLAELPLPELQARAIVYACQPEKSNWQKSIQVLEEMNSRGEMAGENQFLLGQMYEKIGDLSKADSIFESLADPNREAVPTYLFKYADNLMKRNLADRAAPLMERLMKTNPDDFAVIELRSRVLAKRGNPAEAVLGLQRFLEEHPDRRLEIAFAMERIGEMSAAETQYRRAVDNGKSPNETLALAAFYGRRDRLKDAIAVCMKAKNIRSDAIASAMLEIISQSNTRTDADLNTVNDWFTDAIKKSPDSPILYLQQGNLLGFLKRYDEAIESFKQCLTRSPDNPFAMNNLAYFLAGHQKKYDEAINLLQKAKDTLGIVPSILDTEATVRIFEGKYAEAIPLLNDSILQSSSAIAYYHLAQAKLAMSDQVGARAAWKEANALGLKPSSVHPLELDNYVKLRRELGAI